jgi:phosphoribosylaminoimidazole-succinocarboxamide synthase
MKNIIILASGNGSNYQYITEHLDSSKINIVALICNKPKAKVVQKANNNNHKFVVLEQGDLSRERYDLELVSAILNLNKKIDLIVLAGWMRILTSKFINAFDNIINLHPALPGQFPGATAIEEAFNAFQNGKINKTGVMVHKVIEELDAGEVINYCEVEIKNDDTLESLRARVQNSEKSLLLNSIMNTLDLNVISGKVRDRWDIGNNLLCFFHSDRLSSFDRHICNIDGKGRLLNLINNWWMTHTRHIIDNHLLYIKDNYLIAKKCQLIPLEIIVRGYITGNTETSLWTHYNKHFNVDNRTDKFIYCGLEFENGLVKNQKLNLPVITPTTKGIRDELISRRQILDEGIVTEDQLDFIYKKAQQLFDFGTYEANKRGLILVDTKYEFGLDENGEIILIDEIHTCDSSRYWIKENFDINKPKNMDKDSARDYVKSVCNPYKVEKIPEVPNEQKDKVFSCYMGLYERLTGKTYSEKRMSDVLVNTKTPIIEEYYKNHHSPTAVILSGSPSDDWHIEKLRKNLGNHNIYFREHVCSAHKKTKQLLNILDEYNLNKERKIVFITVAGMSNALSGVVTCNTHHPVIACPPHSDKMDMIININSTLQMPSKVPVAIILHAENCVLFCKKILS